MSYLLKNKLVQFKRTFFRETENFKYEKMRNGVTKSCKSNDKKMTNNDLQNTTQNTKDRATRTPLINRGNRAPVSV